MAIAAFLSERGRCVPAAARRGTAPTLAALRPAAIRARCPSASVVRPAAGHPPRGRGRPRMTPRREAASLRDVSEPRSRLGRRTRAALSRLAESRAQVLAALAFVAIVAGFALHLAGAPEAGHQVWRAAVALLAVEL